MTTRLNPYTSRYDLMTPLIACGRSTEDGLDKTVAELIKIRASQINGCAACLVMHTRDARAHGETDERMHLLNAWRESTLFTERERAVLAWTEALTGLPRGGVSDDVYASLRQHFTDEEQVRITVLIGVINAFNRVNVGFHVQPVATPAGQAA